MKDLIKILKKPPFSFSEKQSRSVVKCFGKSNTRRLIQCFQELDLIGKSWKEVGIYLKHPFQVVPEVNINVRLQIAARLCGFNLSTGEAHEIVQIDNKVK